MRKIRNLLLISGFALLSIITFPVNAVPSSTSIVGEYACKGHDPFSNNEYNNVLSISSTGNTYTFQWNGSNGYPVQYGTGVMNTQAQNVVAVAFWDAKDLERKGIISYQISSDGSLQASWTLKTESKVGSEVCTRKQ